MQLQLHFYLSSMTHIEKVDHSIEESYLSPPARKSHGRRRTVYISGLLAALGGVRYVDPRVAAC
jgi:hypothetical protein